MQRAQLSSSQALAGAKDLTLDQAYDLYINSIKTVVAASYASKLRQELLTRVILNQCLKLVYGVPSADGKSLQEPGVLAANQAPEVLVSIMEDSIELAIEYLPKEQGAIEGNKLASLPYTELADKRLVLSWKWSHLVVGWKAQQGILSESLQQWLKIVKRPDNMSIMARAKSITRAEGLAEELPNKQLPEQVRMLRAFFASSAGLKTNIPMSRAAEVDNRAFESWLIQRINDSNKSNKTDTNNVLGCADQLVQVKGVSSKGFGKGHSEAIAICRFELLDILTALRLFSHRKAEWDFVSYYQFAKLFSTESINCGISLANKESYPDSVSNAVKVCDKEFRQPVPTAWKFNCQKNWNTGENSGEIYLMNSDRSVGEKVYLRKLEEYEVIEKQVVQFFNRNWTIEKLKTGEYAGKKVYGEALFKYQKDRCFWNSKE